MSLGQGKLAQKRGFMRERVKNHCKRHKSHHIIIFYLFVCHTYKKRKKMNKLQ